LHINLLKDSTKISLLTLVSRVLGFIRDIFLAYFLGATVGLDAFLIAFKLPNLMRRMYAEGALQQGIVPKLKDQHNLAQESQLFAEIVGSLGVIALFLMISLVLFSPHVIALIAPGYLFSPIKMALSSHLLRFIAPYIGFTLIAGAYAAFLNTKNQFIVPAMMPILLNISFIAVLFFARVNSDLTSWLALSISLTGLVQVLILALVSYQKVAWKFPRLAIHKPRIKVILLGMMPTVVIVSVIYIGFFIDTLFASTLATGNVSWLYFSERLTLLPVSLISGAIATALLPKLLFKHRAMPSASVKQSLGLALTFAIPAALGLYCLSGEIVSTLFNHGAFSTYDAAMTKACLRAFSIGIPAFIIAKIIVVHYFANNQHKKPFICACVAIFVNILLNILWVKSLGHVGLALATSIAGIANVALLFIDYSKQTAFEKKDYLWLFKCILLNLIFAGYLWKSKVIITNFISGNNTQLMVMVLLAVLFYSILWWLFNIETMKKMNESRVS